MNAQRPNVTDDRTSQSRRPAAAGNSNERPAERRLKNTASRRSRVLLPVWAAPGDCRPDDACYQPHCRAAPRGRRWADEEVALARRVGSRRQVEPFGIDEEWVGSLPFDRVLHGAFHLPIECVVYVPSTTAESSPIGEEEFRARVDETAAVLVDLFGGCRESTARGRYRDQDGNLIVEEVAVVTGYGKVEDYTEQRQRLLEWLIDVKARWGQESIGFEFEGDLWYL